MDKFQLFNANTSSQQDMLYDSGGARPGFASVAQDVMESAIDLNRDLVVHPESTFYARVQGEAMRDAGVSDGDILVVDKSLELRDGDMAVCILNNEFLVKFVELHNDHVLLVPANPDFEPIMVSESDDFAIWGIVTYVIRKTYGCGRKAH